MSSYMIWVYQLLLVPLLAEAHSGILPLKVIGVGKPTSLEDIDCKASGTQLSPPIDQIEILLPFLENPTRTGYFCVRSKTTIVCTPHWLSYSMETRSSLSPISKRECMDYVSRYAHGHDSGMVWASPDCSYWSTATKDSTVIVVQRVRLPFDPSVQGVVSRAFEGGSCDSNHCPSRDGLSHWILDETEHMGCDQLNPGFGELRSFVRLDREGCTMSTNVFSDVPLGDLCIGEDYCGHKTILAEANKGVLLGSPDLLSSGELLSHIKACPAESRVRPLRGEEYQSLPNRRDLIHHVYSSCLSVLDSLKGGSSLEERFLGAFTPVEEGIYPGYRIEQGVLYRYDLLYIEGTFAPPSSSVPDPNHGWTIKDPTGTTHSLQAASCVTGAGTQASLLGPTCRWFNGITLSGSDVNIPRWDNGYRSPYLQPIEDGSRKEDEGHPPQGPLSFNSPPWVWAAAASVEIVIIVLLWLLMCKCQRDRRVERMPGPMQKRSPPSLISLPLYEVMSGPSIARPPLSLGTFGRQTGSRAIEDVPHRNDMIEWFG